MEWEKAKRKWLDQLLLVKEEIVERHMTDMLSFGDPVSHYYRHYEKQQRSGINSLLTTSFEQLFTVQCDYEMYVKHLSVEAYKWGETWAKADIPKEVLLQVLFHLREHTFAGVLRCLRTCDDEGIKEQATARIHDMLNLRYHHTMRGYLAYKDKLINHLHQQKIGVIGQMAAGMAHEIRNPLTAFQGFLQLMKKGLEQKDQEVDREGFIQYIQICQHEVEALESLVTNFLILARKNEDSAQKKKTVELRELLQRVHDVSRHYVIEKDVNLEFHYDRLHYPVKVIPSYVEQICLNLIKNAVDAVSIAGDVRVGMRLTQPQTHVVITVMDNGCGIPEERMKYLFEPFYTTREKGTGIGLSVCKKLVEELDGQIRVQSKEGFGTTVEIWLKTEPVTV